MTIPFRSPATRTPATSADVAARLRPHLRAVTQEVAAEIRGHVPEYARSANSRYDRRMRQNITRTVERFMEMAGGDERARLDDVVELYVELGARAAQEGRGLERLETAIRTGGRVACRRLITDAYRLEWPHDTLAGLTDLLFSYLDELCAAAARGHASVEPATDRERDRARLRDLIVAMPPPSETAIGDLARAACWELPRTIGVVAVLRGQDATVPILPPTVLTRWDEPVAFLIVPDPEGPGQSRLLASVARTGVAALGPTVPVTQGAASLRWATRALDLVRGGVLAVGASGMVRCVDHVVTLTASAGDDLLGASIGRRLAPLLSLAEGRREQLMTTLLTYLECGESTALTAERLAVHQQTVRYRVHRLQELFGGSLCEPEVRLELMLALHAYLRLRGPA